MLGGGTVGSKEEVTDLRLSKGNMTLPDYGITLITKSKCHLFHTVPIAFKVTVMA